MSDETQSAPQAPRNEHAGAALNPEQHLLEAHNLSIRLQGKEGTWERGVWALLKEEKGKTKTLTVFEGTRREAANHFFKFIHPNMTETPQVASRRPSREFRPSRGTGRPQGRGQGRS